MITQLSRLSMSRYIDLVCGDLSVLKSAHEVCGRKELEQTRKRLMIDFATLSDSVTAKSAIREQEGRRRADMELVLFQVLNNLVAMGAFGEVREVLAQYGICQEMTDKQTAAEVARLLARARTNSERMAKEIGEKAEIPAENEIRERFDRQTASLMTYYKFQINLDKMPASQYACMFDQANREIRAKLAAMRR